MKLKIDVSMSVQNGQKCVDIAAQGISPTGPFNVSRRVKVQGIASEEVVATVKEHIASIKEEAKKLLETEDKNLKSQVEGLSEFVEIEIEGDRSIPPDKIFRSGDRVFLNSGGPALTVEFVNGYDVNCRLGNEFTTFPAVCLTNCLDGVAYTEKTADGLLTERFRRCKPNEDIDSLTLEEFEQKILELINKHETHKDMWVLFLSAQEIHGLCRAAGEMLSAYRGEVENIDEAWSYLRLLKKYRNLNYYAIETDSDRESRQRELGKLSNIIEGLIKEIPNKGSKYKKTTTPKHGMVAALEALSRIDWYFGFKEVSSSKNDDNSDVKQIVDEYLDGVKVTYSDGERVEYVSADKKKDFSPGSAMLRSVFGDDIIGDENSAPMMLLSEIKASWSCAYVRIEGVSQDTVRVKVLAPYPSEWMVVNGSMAKFEVLRRIFPGGLLPESLRCVVLGIMKHHFLKDNKLLHDIIVYDLH